MKLEEKPFDELIIGAEKEMDFTIDTDSSLIFEILRDKMYKDKIGSICREVMSNCRDANREANSDKNISVTIIEPNQVVYVGHQSVSFKDNGIGISPDRMAGIYVRYASSTKRDSNKQTGGFGLGAKTPFAYNDTFTVVTVCDVDGVRMKYYYTALIDSSRRGKMILFDSEETTDETGTEVIVPIKTPSDRAEFERKAFFYTKYWGCVDYINFSSTPVLPKMFFSYPEYDIVEADQTCLVIDGIPYPLETGWGFKDLKMGRGYAVALKFETGQLTISANRESVQYDDKTVELLKDRSQFVYEELVKTLNNFITNMPSYLEACRFKVSLEHNDSLSRDGNELFNLMIACIGTKNFHRYVLSDDFRSESLTYQGRPVKSRIEFLCHKIEKVVDRTYTSRGKVYTEISYFPLRVGGSDKPVYYGDNKKDSRRNATIFEEDTEFYLITPDSKYTPEEIAEDLLKITEDFGITFNSYKEVEPMKVTRSQSTRIYSQIPAYVHLSWGNESEDLFWDSKTKQIFDNESCTKLFDLEKTCFLGVERANARTSYGLTRSMIDFVINEGYRVIQVNRSALVKKLSKVKGLKMLNETYEKVYKDNYSRWEEEGKKYLVAYALSDISWGLISYYDLLPEGTLPKIVTDYGVQVLRDSFEYKESYLKTNATIKIDSKGIKNKIRKNLRKYPLLEVYLNHSQDEDGDKEKNIKNYINLIENYEK